METGVKRLRRLRMDSWQRQLFQENRLHVKDLILPLFVCEGDMPRMIPSLPGVIRYSVAELPGIIHRADSLGIAAVMLFPCTPPNYKDERATEAFNPDNLMAQAIRTITDTVPTMGIIADVALDPYTSHGHDGILVNGVVSTDATVPLLVKQALLLAAAGARAVAPSDMMDGRVKAIRAALDEEGYTDVAIMSYAAKFASGLYGAFREAVGSASALQGLDKRSYQLNVANRNDAMAKIAQDYTEGADCLIVKPAQSSLDIIYQASMAVTAPIIAYQVSGEYAMIQFAAKAGVLHAQSALLESLITLKRAGARAIITYGALDVANWIAQDER